MDDKVRALTGKAQVQRRPSEDEDGTAFENCELVLDVSIAEERMHQLHERVCGQCCISWLCILRVLASIIGGIGSHLIAKKSSVAISAFDGPILIDRDKGLQISDINLSFGRIIQKDGLLDLWCTLSEVV